MTSVSTDRRQGVNSGAAIKVPVRVATTANITLSGEQTIDGVACVTDDRVLVKNQTDQTANGIYTVDTGSWTRTVDADGTFDLKHGTIVYVVSGTAAAGLFYVCTSPDPIDIDTDNITWAVVSPSSPISFPIGIAQGGTGQTAKAAAAAALGVVSLTGAAGTANAQTAAAPSSYTAFTANDVFVYTPGATNTGAVSLTLTPSGGGALAAKNVFNDKAACVGGELVSGVQTLLQYDGTQFNIVGYSRKVRGSQLGPGSGLINGTIVPSQNGTVLTVAIKTLAGADPSAADPVGVIFRNVTAKTGDYTVIWLTAATSISTTVGGTFGVANSVAFRLWVAGFNDGGTFRLALINCLTTVAGAGAGRDVTAIYPLAQFGIASATQIGAGSTSAGVFYSAGAAVASKAYATIGYLTYEAGLAAAGTFAVDETRSELYRLGVPLPGQVIQVARNDTGASATGTTTVPNDNTIPQNTEGDQYMSQAVTPTSAANVLRVIAVGEYANSSAGDNVMVQSIYQDSTANAVKSAGTNSTQNQHQRLHTEALILASTTSSTTFKARTGYGAAGTTTFNGASGSQAYGGVLNSYMEIDEVMA